MSKKDVKKKAPQKIAPTPQKPAVREEQKSEAQLAQASPTGKKLSERQLILQSHRDEKRQRGRSRLITIGVVLGLLAVVVLSVILGSNKPSVVATVTDEGSLDCFPAGLTDAQGAPLACRVSAVLFDGSNLNLVSSNPIPGEGYSSAFSVPFAAGKVASDTITYQTAEPVMKALDLESMAISWDGKYVLAMTGFDRVKSDSSEWNYYNMLVAWPTSDPSQVKVLDSTTTAEGVVSSVSMRNKFAQMLTNAAYFKVGGMAAIPGNYLMFGLTDIGQSAENHETSIKIVAVPYTINAESGDITLSDRYQVKSSFDPAISNPEIGHTLSLTSLEYDPYLNRLLILAGYDEGEQGSGAYLWVLSIADMNNGALPQLVQDETGKPFELANSPQGLTVLDKNIYLVATNANAESPQKATYQIITLNR